MEDRGPMISTVYDFLNKDNIYPINPISSVDVRTSKVMEPKKAVCNVLTTTFQASYCHKGVRARRRYADTGNHHAVNFIKQDIKSMMLSLQNFMLQ